MGWESPAVNCRCVHRSFYIRYRKIVIGKLRRQDIKMLIRLSIRCESQDLLWYYSVSAFRHRNDVFGLWGKGDSYDLFLRSYLNCDSSQENSAVVIFKIAAVFYLRLTRRWKSVFFNTQKAKIKKGLNHNEIKKKSKLCTVNNTNPCNASIGYIPRSYCKHKKFPGR